MIKNYEIRLFLSLLRESSSHDKQWQAKYPETTLHPDIIHVSAQSIIMYENQNNILRKFLTRKHLNKL